MNAIIVFERGSKVHFIVKRLRAVEINAEVISTPMKLSENGCGYAVKVSYNDIGKVVSVIREYNVKYLRIYKVVKPGVYVTI